MKQRKRREALLPVDNGVLAPGEHDAAHEVHAVAGDIGAVVRGVIPVQELIGQVIDKLLHLLILPSVLALVVMDGILGVLQKLLECLLCSRNLPHSLVLTALDAWYFELAGDSFGYKRLAVFTQLVG